MSTTTSRRNYTREFKLEAVKLVVEQGRTFSDVAGSLGIDQSQPQRWKSQLKAEGVIAFLVNGKVNPHEEELRELRRELNRVRQETLFPGPSGWELPPSPMERRSLCSDGEALVPEHQVVDPEFLHRTFS